MRTSSEVHIEQLENSDCGVVLTGSPGRVKEAFEVLLSGKINRLIVSGVYKDAQLKELFPGLASHPEINPENIILEKISATTKQNAEQSLQLTQSLKCQNILLMTSHLHMYRAERVFRAIFPEGTDIRTYPIVNPNKEGSELDIFWETIKSLFYSFQSLFVSI